MFSLMTTFGTIALVGGSLGYFFFPMGLKFSLETLINLSEHGVVFPIYMNPPFGGNSQFYLFAIGNPREVLRGGKMSLQTKGPYKFESILTRDNIVFSKQGDRVRFDSGRKMIPKEAETASSFDEQMWLFNPVLPATVKTVRSMVLDRIPFPSVSEPIVFNAVNLLLETYNERLMVQSTPRDLLMGRKIELLEALTGLATRFGLASLIPPGLPDNIFGLAYAQNVTVINIEVWTGIGASRDKFAEVFKWKDKSKMDIWRGKCNTIEGTNGELYKPLLVPGEPIKVFFYPLCRSLYLVPVGNGTPITLPETGVQVLEYDLSPRTYLGARNNPDNKCYCDNVKSYDCQYDGLIALGPCFFDQPIFMGTTYFKNADDRIRRSVDFDLQADALSKQAAPPDLQRLSLEPITGTVLRVNLTLMAAIKMVKQPYMRDLAKVRNISYVPLMALSEQVLVPFKFVWPIYLLQKFNDNHETIMAGTAATGVAMLVVKFFF